MKILYVDDCKVELSFASRLIPSMGDHKVVVAKSKNEAIEKLVQHRDIDLIVTDFHMFNETGLDVAKMVKDFNLGIPVVLLTGKSERSRKGADVSVFDMICEKTGAMSVWARIIDAYKGN